MTNSTIATEDSITILFQGDRGRVGHQPLLQTTVNSEDPREGTKTPQGGSFSFMNIH